jgi:hypothetical protein
MGAHYWPINFFLRGLYFGIREARSASRVSFAALNNDSGVYGNSGVYPRIPPDTAVCKMLLLMKTQGIHRFVGYYPPLTNRLLYRQTQPDYKPDEGSWILEASSLGVFELYII